MNRYKFSICIPTWNRASLLKETLHNLTLQIKSKSDFQVVVSDNSSTDDTLLVVNEFSAKLNIKYLRWDENIGGSKNIVEVVNHSDGRYCVLLGDDDIFRDGWLDSLDYLVSNYNPDVISSDRIVCDIGLNPKFEEKCGPVVQAPTIFNCADDGVLFKYLSLTHSTSGFGFLSNLVVKKTAWKSSVDCEFVNNHPFPHMIKILDVLQKGGTLLRISQNTVYARTGNHRLEDYVSNTNATDFEKLLTVHFEGFLSAANFLFSDSSDLRMGLLNPILRIFDEEYKLYFLKMAEDNNLVGRAGSFLYQLHYSGRSQI